MTPIDLKHRSELAALHPVDLDEPGAPPVALGATVAGPGGQPLVAAAGKVDPYYLTGPGAPSAAPPAAPEADDPLLDGSLVAAAQVIEEVRLERISAGATEK
ncbi:hypothetical protein HYH03_014761 [Edaphochlamys debaryana]|uniref:Uncharacterized protein n=1 Tax=Edaphochlamys debaryana TaxID=47281 RepID=A0A835XQV2_9CHLO|nr:hypothetical protein HYH03_014761 [Edaphochlamys debaryana]|eukprot:KAG2486591.1 hypothetical protein HYH03_014761 [Edaphochlamys debaryana]